MREGLRHPEAEERRKALAALSAAEVAHALDEIFPLLDDADWRVRREAAHALARMSDPGPAIEPLLDAVETGDVARRNAAIEALRHFGPAAASAVLARLPRARSGARRFLIEVLSETGTEACVGPLSELLDDPDPNVPPAAAESLGRIRGAVASEALARALAHRDPVVRLAALQAFAMRDESLPWDALEPLMHDPLCRRVALRAAANCSDPRALATIVAALSDANAALSAEAAVACATAARHGRREGVRQALLARPGASRVLRHLCERGASPEVRRASIECLGLIADAPSVVYVLRGAQSPETSASADEALERFGAEAVSHALGAVEDLGPHALTALLRWALQRATPRDHADLVRVAWRTIEDGYGGIAAWDVVATIGSREDALALLARVEARASHMDPGEYSRPFATLLARFPDLGPRMAQVAPAGSRLGLTIAEMLASAGHAVAVEPIREALTAQDPGVRAAAVRALAAASQAGARDALEFALADEDPTVQAAAAEALGSIGAGRELLEESLRAAEPRVRQAAARALARQGRRVRSVLLPALDDPDPAVVLAALEGLGAEATVDDLMGLTTHADPDVAAEALLRLRARDAAAASRAAEGMLDHPVWSVRLEAVRSVDPARPELLAALRARRERERDELVREAIDAVLASGEGDRPGGGRGSA